MNATQIYRTSTASLKQPSVTLKEEYKFYLLMMQVVQGIVKVRENELRLFGITPVQADLMKVLKTAKYPPTAGHVAHRLGRRPASVYQLLDSLASKGLVKCIKRTDGKHEVRAKLTKEGEKTYEKLVSGNVMKKISRPLSAKEQKQLAGILDKLHDAIFSDLASQP